MYERRFENMFKDFGFNVAYTNKQALKNSLGYPTDITESFGNMEEL